MAETPRNGGNVSMLSSAISGIVAPLVASFGPSETILVLIAALMLGVVMGWLPSPMMNIINEVHNDEMVRASASVLTQEHAQQEIIQQTQVMSLLRTICVHDSTTDQQKQDCWK